MDLREYLEMDWQQQILIGPPSSPVLYREDSSTGYGQIFAETAAVAINYAVGANIIDWQKCDYNDVDQRYALWKELKNNNEFNIEKIALVLIRAADLAKLSNDYCSYSDQDIKSMFARYNGTNAQAFRKRVFLHGQWMLT